MPTRSEAAITVMLNDFKFSSKILNRYGFAQFLSASSSLPLISPTKIFGYYTLFVSTCID